MNTDLSREDDYPPRRYGRIGKIGPYAGHKCDKDMWDKMLDKYYELHGWDIETGLPTPESLKQIGLEDIAQMIAGRGLMLANKTKVDQTNIKEIWKKKGEIILDETKCRGCNTCMLACSFHHASVFKGIVKHKVSVGLSNRKGQLDSK